MAAAETDPEAAAKLQEYRERQRALSKARRQRDKERAEVDPEFAAKKKEQAQRYAERHKRHIEELRAKAPTDANAKEAVERIDARKKKAWTKANEVTSQRMKDDPEYAEQLRAKRRVYD